MDRLHQRRERAERQSRDAGERRLHHDGERAELQRHDAAKDRRQHQLRPALTGEELALHERPVDEEIAHEAAVERHIPHVCPQRQQTAVGEEQRLDGEDHDHRQKSRPGPEDGAQQHAAAEVAGRAGAGNGIVDHLAREDERGHDGHRRQLFLCKLRRGGLFLVELDQRNARRGRGSRVHRDGHCRGYQRVSHVHSVFLQNFFLLLLYRTHRPGKSSPRGIPGAKKLRRGASNNTNRREQICGRLPKKQKSQDCRVKKANGALNKRCISLSWRYRAAVF